MKNKIYVAAPLFSEAEKTFNKQLKQRLLLDFDVYLPQEDGMLIVDLIKKGISFADASSMVFKADVRAIISSDFLLIVLDGRTVDEGAAMELGFAYSNGKRCIGYSTDPRSLLPDGQNPMIMGCLETTVHSIEELREYIFKPQEVIICESFLSHA
jgi:nucleoside 2-deoxyribosyltransferase